MRSTSYSTLWQLPSLCCACGKSICATADCMAQRCSRHTRTASPSVCSGHGQEQRAQHTHGGTLCSRSGLGADADVAATASDDLATSRAPAAATSSYGAHAAETTSRRGSTPLRPFPLPSLSLRSRAYSHSNTHGAPLRCVGERVRGFTAARSQGPPDAYGTAQLFDRVRPPLR